MFEHPDSALHILQTMPRPSVKDEEQHALWCLLTTQAKYKQLLPIPSDSLIRIAYDYYKSTDNARRKAMAALYMAGVNYDLNKSEEALQYYLEAKTEVEKTHDYKLGHLIMSGLNTLYLYRGLTDYATEASKKAYNYAVLDSCVLYQVSSLQDMARNYCLLDSLDKAIAYYQKCASMLLEQGDMGYYYAIQSEIALVYTNSDRFQESMQLMKTIPISELSEQMMVIIGENYLELHESDSAFYYLNKALSTNNVYTRSSIYSNLYKLSSQPAYRQYMRMYCDSLLFYRDSVRSVNKEKEIIAYKEKYDQQKLLTEKQRLELENAEVTNWLLFVIILVLLLATAVVYLFLRRRIAVQKKEEELNKMAIQLHENEAVMDKNNAYIVELQNQIQQSHEAEELVEEQEKLLAELRKENEQLHAENNRLQDKMTSAPVSSHELANIKLASEKLRQTELRIEELCMQLLEQNPTLYKLHQKPEYLNDSALKEICRITDSVYGKFCKRLVNDVPSLRENEIALCCLIKLRFSISEMAVMLNMAPASVSRSKLRVKNKIFQELGVTSAPKGSIFGFGNTERISCLYFVKAVSK